MSEARYTHHSPFTIHRSLEQDVLLKILITARAVYMLRPGALFESELSLAVGAADITVSLEVSYLHILPLEKVTHRAPNAEKTVVLIHTLSDVGRQRAQYRYRS